MHVFSYGETPLVNPWAPVHLSPSLLPRYFYYCSQITAAFTPFCVTCASPCVPELTTQLRRPCKCFWLPLCRINKLGYTSLEDYYDPLDLWDITPMCSFFFIWFFDVPVMKSTIISSFFLFSLKFLSRFVVCSSVLVRYRWSNLKHWRILYDMYWIFHETLKSRWILL